MRVEPTIKTASFSGHESFPLRYAWLKKAHHNISTNPRFFSSESAMTELGVGKNMVRAIRHWGLTCGTLTESAESERRDELEPTDFGRHLLREGGWDPFLEDIGTIWWLHWRVVTNPFRATTWSWVFSRPGSGRVRKEMLVHELLDLAHRHKKTKASEASLKRDVDVFMRSYLHAKPGRGRSIEDALDSPFLQLHMLRETHERGEFELTIGRQRSLPIEIFHAALLDYVTKRYDSAAAVSVDELAYSPDSPGRVFRLSPDALSESLWRLTSESPHLDMHETAGIQQVVVAENAPSVKAILDCYYTTDAPEAQA